VCSSGQCAFQPLGSGSDAGSDGGAPGDGGVGVSVSINPASVTLYSAGTLTFGATVSGTPNTQVVWSVVEGSAGGFVTTGGSYTAPNAIVTSVFHVLATSVADPTARASATVTVVPLVQVSVSPSSTFLSPGETAYFGATVTGAADTSVVWSIQEGAAGGTIDQNGVYVGPAATYVTYHVVATSVADPTRSASASVAMRPPISVSICPQQGTLLPGDLLTLTPSVSGAMSPGVSWSVTPFTTSTGKDGGGAPALCGAFDGGLFSAFSVGGECTTQITATSLDDPRRSASATLSVDSSPVLHFTGTATYGGSQTGRVYVTFQTSGGGGTSIAAPGRFDIRGITAQAGSTLSVLGYMDTLGTGAFNAAADPSTVVTVQLQANGTFTVDGGAVFSGILALADPAAVVPPQPTLSGVVPANGGAVISFNSVQDGAGNELADHYVIYASTTPNPGPTNNAASVTVRGGTGGTAILRPLSTGTSYYFAVQALNGALRSAVSPAIGPVVIGAQSGGHSVSGTVSFAGFPPAGTLAVVLGLNPLVYATLVTNPSSPQSFTISGVPDGMYEVEALIDLDGNGELGPLDPSQLRFFPVGPIVSVRGASVSGVQITFAPSDVVTQTVTFQFGGPGIYQLMAQTLVLPGLKIPVRSETFFSTAVPIGPPPPGPFSPVSDLEVLWPGPMAFFSNPPPNQFQGVYIGQQTNLLTTFADGITCSATAVVTDVVDRPFGLSPSTNYPVSGTPTFSWSPPFNQNYPPYRYLIDVSGPTGPVWHYRHLDATQTQVPYNVDGRATPASLSPGFYSWSLTVMDGFGNMASGFSNFTVGGADGGVDGGP
jgi:hypothetical protein